MTGTLQGMVAFVTGACRGGGGGIALALTDIDGRRMQPFRVR